MTKLQELNQKNDVNIHDVHSDAFRSYGRVIEGYDIAPLLSYMREHTEIPETGNVYVPSVPEMEEYPIFEELQSVVYGGMPIQMGYCNGRNTTYNGFEYHKGSEINIAVTDFMLVLGHSYDIEDNTYHAKDAVVFYVPEGTVIEMYQTTLHLSPLRVFDRGFRDIVVLPRGTNTPLKERIENPTDEESVLLLQTNKWVICHPDREPLVKQGAHTGMLGENKELYY
jgi:hypothetical protein